MDKDRVSWDEFYRYRYELSDSQAEDAIERLSAFGRVTELLDAVGFLNYQNAVRLIDRALPAGVHYTATDIVTALDPDDCGDHAAVLYIILHADGLSIEDISDISPYLTPDEISWLS